ncbi:Meiotic recombination protein rec12 [Colletotrichum sp. SAR11_59]|nr:Meiotic recombination protein rec12 [Colletotrichum sp. SAR11_59]
MKLLAQVLKIIHLSHSSLLSGNPVTKRNLFYQCPDLFKTQAIVDGLVDDISYTLGIGRDDLNIGKGVPDLQTKQFLHLLHSAKPEIPIYGLVDFDPYGINIMRCCSHGSRGHAHEVGVTVPSMHWLGIKSDDLLGRRDLEVDDDSAFSRQQISESSFEGTDALKERDRKIAKTLLGNIPADLDEYNIECRRELQIMLFLNVKAEIQAVDDAGDISNWLDAHMRRV